MLRSIEIPRRYDWTFSTARKPELGNKCLWNTSSLLMTWWALSDFPRDPLEPMGKNKNLMAVLMYKACEQ